MVYARMAIGAMDGDIWLVPTNATIFSQAVQITRGPADDSHPRFARDGQSIFFVSNRQDRYGLNGIFATERRGTNLWRVRRYDLP
jgi:Tol biopolymer transport system component